MKKVAMGIITGLVLVAGLTFAVTKTTKLAQIIPVEGPTQVAAATDMGTDQIIPVE